MSTVSEILGLNISETFPPYKFIPFPEGTVMVPFTNNLMKSDHTQLVWKKSIVPGYRLFQITAICPTKDSAIYKWTHPNCLWKGPKMLYFKHSRSNGSKFWTHKAGMVFYFAIPESKIKIYVEEDHTYPEIDIDGTKVTLTCSGGGAENWASWVNDPAYTTTFHKVKEIKEIAQHSADLPQLRELLKLLDKDEDKIKSKQDCEKTWNKKQAFASKTVKVGDSVIVKSEYGIEQPLKVLRIDYCNKKVQFGPPEEKTSIYGDKYQIINYKYVETKRISGLSCDRFYIKANQIDWVETNKMKKTLQLDLTITSTTI